MNSPMGPLLDQRVPAQVVLHAGRSGASDADSLQSLRQPSRGESSPFIFLGARVCTEQFSLRVMLQCVGYGVQVVQWTP